MRRPPGKGFVVAPPPLYGVVALLLLALAADAPPPRAEPKPLALTPAERQAVLGFMARAELVRREARDHLNEIGREHDAYMAGVAARLGMTVEKFRAEYTVEMPEGVVTPKAKAQPKGPEKP